MRLTQGARVARRGWAGRPLWSPRRETVAGTKVGAVEVESSRRDREGFTAVLAEEKWEGEKYPGPFSFRLEVTRSYRSYPHVTWPR